MNRWIVITTMAQRDQYPELADLLPYHHYCRKNIGYLYAIRQGADCILETDDDNLPLPSFGRDIESEVTLWIQFIIREKGSLPAWSLVRYNNFWRIVIRM